MTWQKGQNLLQIASVLNVHNFIAVKLTIGILSKQLRKKRVLKNQSCGWNKIMRTTKIIWWRRSINHHRALYDRAPHALQCVPREIGTASVPEYNLRVAEARELFYRICLGYNHKTYEDAKMKLEDFIKTPEYFLNNGATTLTYLKKV